MQVPRAILTILDSNNILCNRLAHYKDGIMAQPDSDISQQDLPMSLNMGGDGDLVLTDLAPDIQELAKKPGRIMCGDIHMRIDANATWFYNGSPIGRKEMVKLFSTVLHLDELGQYWMITPAEMARIKVDDAPFTALELITEGSGDNMTISFRTNVDTIIALDEDHPLRITHDDKTSEPRPYITVRDGLDALIVRSAFYQLIEEGVEMDIDGEQILGVWSHGCFFRIGPTGPVGT